MQRERGLPLGLALGPSDCVIASSQLVGGARPRLPRASHLWKERDFAHVRAAPMPAQALAKYKSVRPARRVAGQSRYTTNIATHNESEEFVIRIRSSTTEITC